MTDAPILLRGMTWDHARGYEPLAATAVEYNKLHPEVRVTWERRSLKDFEEFPVGKLAEDFDLVVFDHPFVGDAAHNGPLLPLDEHLPEPFLQDQAANSTGSSHRSYTFAGRQWGLAIDAAAPVAFWRDDILERLGASAPQTWEDLLMFAHAGHVEIPAAPINCLMNFYSLCVALGEAPFAGRDCVVDKETGTAALIHLRELVTACDAGCLERNPIASHELVASAKNTRVACCPLAYGYSNYSRDGFRAHPVRFGQPPAFAGNPLRTVLGGTGLGVSAIRVHREAAVDYAAFVASGEVQRALYTRHGGQPGHRGAWLDAENNRLTRECFRLTLPALDRAWVRPRYFGHIAFQENAGPVVHAAVRGDLVPAEALAQVNSIYHDSLEHATALA
ncbi:MAG: extracellular solute-binding protein [Opitutaceae bacterium]